MNFHSQRPQQDPIIELPEDLFLSLDHCANRNEGTPVNRMETNYQILRFSSSFSCFSDSLEDMSGYFSINNSEPRKGNKLQIYDNNAIGSSSSIPSYFFDYEMNLKDLPAVPNSLSQIPINNINACNQNKILQQSNLTMDLLKEEADAEMIIEEKKSEHSYTGSGNSVQDLESNIQLLSINHSEEKVKRSRTKLKQHNFHLKSKRRDVVFKTILRQMRKCLTKEFNKTTNYLNLKNQNAPGLLLDKLEEFLSRLKISQKYTKSKEELRNSSNDSVFFLGAFLYPRQMKETTLDSKRHKLIDLIHSCLYSFSICKLDFLNQFPVYSHLLLHFIKNYKDQSLKLNQTMASDKFDYNEGFKYLQKYYKVSDL